MQLNKHSGGGYSFLTGIAPYSSGVIALHGHRIIRLRFHKPPPYQRGLQDIEKLITGLGRPIQSLCAVELRCPTPYSFEGFAAFNADYADLLKRMGLLMNGANPIARTNVAPAGISLSEPVLYACSYTIPDLSHESGSTFVVAGAGDLVDQADLSVDAIVRRGETSPDAMRAKADCVIGVMQDRLAGLGEEWANVASVNVYTVQPIHHLLETTLQARIGPNLIHGIQWYFSQPPIRDLEFEMDLRRIHREEWID